MELMDIVPSAGQNRSGIFVIEKPFNGRNNLMSVVSRSGDRQPDQNRFIKAGQNQTRRI